MFLHCYVHLALLTKSIISFKESRVCGHNALAMPDCILKLQGFINIDVRLLLVLVIMMIVSVSVAVVVTMLSLVALFIVE